MGEPGGLNPLQHGQYSWIRLGLVLIDPEDMVVVDSKPLPEFLRPLFRQPAGRTFDVAPAARLMEMDTANHSAQLAVPVQHGADIGEQVEVRGLDQLEERLMAHFNDLPMEEEPRKKRTYQKRNRITPKPAPIHLKNLLLRFVRGGQVRTVSAGGPVLEIQPEGWSSGKLLAWLEEQGGGRRDRAGWLRRLLYHLFAWIRRDLDVDHH